MENEKKYELTDETIEYEGRTLYRIRSLRDTVYASEGELGGYVEHIRNLSHDRDAWVADNAKVMDEAYVAHSALIAGNAVVQDNAFVRGNTFVCGQAQIKGQAQLSEETQVSDFAIVTDKAWLIGTIIVADNAYVGGEATLVGDIEFRGDAYILDEGDTVSFLGVGSDTGGKLHVYRTTNGVGCIRGCFAGTLEEFEQAVEESHGESRIGDEYRTLIQFIKLKFSHVLTK
jgi:acyl-[acyl carrier protein]--UDP-N-acetylglucosamine O-acyltransferase